MDPVPSYRETLLEEPFRLFFALGTVCALAGILPWLLYFGGHYPGYPGYTHGLLQIQGFEMAFAVGFLMTALPRFLETTQTRPWELALGWLLCAAGAACLLGGQLVAGEGLFLGLMLHLTLFGLLRLPGRGDDPPPFFAFIPIGFASGVLGAILILWPAAAFPRLGELFVEQGILLSFVLAIGSHLGPRLLYGPRPFPETTTPAAHWRLAGLFAVGLLLLASFPLEAAGFARAGLLLRACIVSIYLLAALRIYRAPSRPLLHLHLLRLSFFSIAGGLWLAGVDPTRSTASLHLTLAGGFSLMTFVIATRVTVGHAGFEDLWDGHHVATILPLSLIALAVPVRLAADAAPEHQALLLVAASCLWLAGVLVWGLIFIPKMSPWHVAPED